jgi:hypothetical protein
MPSRSLARLSRASHATDGPDYKERQERGNQFPPEIKKTFPRHKIVNASRILRDFMAVGEEHFEWP